MATILGNKKLVGSAKGIATWRSMHIEEKRTSSALLYFCPKSMAPFVTHVENTRITLLFIWNGTLILLSDSTYNWNFLHDVFSVLGMFSPNHIIDYIAFAS
jgi:hypothetical protein